MSDVVIKVENLGKKYIIGHQKQERYTALRDVVAERVRSIGHRLRGKKQPEDPTREEFWALKDVSFEVKQGDRVGIIGRNGAGKSTLLKILSRITEPTEGRINIKGRVASLLEVGTGFHPELTGRENIFLNGAILGMSRVEIARKFDEIVAFAEVEKFLDTPVKRYSSGMYVRLAFAVAAHLEPEILIVDEVLAVGDAQFQKKCLGKMKDIGETSEKTVIFVSHNLEAVKSLCHIGLYLNKGKLNHSGLVENTIEQYITSAWSRHQTYVETDQITRSNHLVSEQFRIIYVKLSEDQVYVGNVIKIYVGYSCESYIDGLKIGLGINTILGQRLCTMHTDSKASLPSQGSVCFEISTDSFYPGQYSVDIGARSGKVAYDSLAEVISFEIVTPPNINFDDDNFGLLVPSCKISHV
jgi:lipopolysaccharide transport system ATP-binding protein